MEVQAFAHHARSIHIILDAAPDEPEPDDRDPMRIAGEERDCDEHSQRQKRADKWNEFEHASDCSDSECVGEAHYQKEGAVRDKSKERKQELSPDVFGEHRVEVIHNTFEKRAILRTPDQLKRRMTQFRTVLQKEQGENRYQ